MLPVYVPGGETSAGRVCIHACTLCHPRLEVMLIVVWHRFTYIHLSRARRGHRRRGRQGGAREIGMWGARRAGRSVVDVQGG